MLGPSIMRARVGLLVAMSACAGPTAATRTAPPLAAGEAEPSSDARAEVRVPAASTPPTEVDPGPGHNSPPDATTDTEADPGPDTTSEAPPPNFEPIKLNEQQLARARAVQPLVAKAAAEHDLDPNLINGVIWTESKFNPKARNKRSGARGLMQLMPGTAKAMAKKLGRQSRPYDPEFAVQAGAKLLALLSAKFDGDEELILFGYARGSGSVRKWQKANTPPNAPMPEGVQKFIARVRRGQATFRELGFPETGSH